MTNINNQLAYLDELLRSGSITYDEYQKERAKIVANNNEKSRSLGMSEDSFLMLMHLSQFAAFLLTGFGFVVPIIMWAINKDKSEAVDRHGKNIFNFMISYFIYSATLAIFAFVFFIGIITIPIAIFALVILIILVILELIFVIIAAVKANNNEFWKYPLSISFFNVD